jgi:hypothetical protein
MRHAARPPCGSGAGSAGVVSAGAEFSAGTASAGGVAAGVSDVVVVSVVTVESGADAVWSSIDFGASPGVLVGV